MSSITIQTDRMMVRKRLAEIIQEKSIALAPPGEPFTLTSGKKSNYYINGKLTAGDPEGVFCIALLILDEVNKTGAQAVGGPTLGADPMVGAIAALSYLLETPITSFLVRKEAKQHGAKKQIEGPDISGLKVILIEDVITTGGSAIKAAGVIRETGAEICDVISLVDREQGGKEAFADAGIPYHPLFTISELLPPAVLNEWKQLEQ